MGMLLLTLFKTQLSLAAASSLMFISTMRQVEMDKMDAQGGLLLEVEADQKPAAPLPVQPKKKEEK